MLASLLSLASLFVSSDCMAPEGPRSLTREQSRRYIMEKPDFRAAIDAEQGGLAARLNLGDHFIDYLTNGDFRGRVLAAVGGDRSRVWSDVENLEFSRIGDEPLVVDMTDLIGLPNLTVFDLSDSQVVNFGAVGALWRTLEILSLEQVSGVDDISVLHGLVNLEKLTLESVDGVLDVSVLSGLVNLRKLHLVDTQVHGKLAGLERLQDLHLTGTNIADMGDLADLTNLTRLDLSECQVVNLAALGGLTTLATLSLDQVGGVQDMSGLHGLVNLGNLQLVDTQVNRISELAGLKRLQHLMVIRTGITDMNDLAGFVTVRDLHFTDMTLQNVHALELSPNLRSLSLNAQNGDINAVHLVGYTKLTYLELRSPNLRNIEALAFLWNLPLFHLNGIRVDNDPIVIAEMQHLLSPHARIADAAIFANAQDRTCCICAEPVKNIADCLLTCDDRIFNHRSCLEKWCLTCRDNGSAANCPSCRARLGPLI